MVNPSVPGKPLTPERLRKNLQVLRQRVEEAAKRSARDSRTVKLMAVTKIFPRTYVEAAREAGITLFGENRVQEALAKYQGLDLELHLIGHLQRNKASKAAGFFRCVQSIDKLETALALEQQCHKLDKAMDILLEVNTSAEESKFGFRRREDLLPVLDRIMELPHLRIRGLMTVGPLTGENDRIRRAFAGLNRLYQELVSRFPELQLDTLSMGMSGDFEIAVEEGSTMIRVGTALFGAREHGAP